MADHVSTGTVAMGEPPTNRSESAHRVTFEQARARLVDELVSRRIDSERVLAAMGAVRRERFVPSTVRRFAYADGPLPIGDGQTISQPFIVALMADAAEIGPADRVLEIGTGSGYGAAVLAELAGEVWTIERYQRLADEAKARLRAEGFDDVHVLVGDGTQGWPAAAPFDAIVVTASGPEVPTALRDQLADGGRLVLPIGRRQDVQSLVRLRRHGDNWESEDLGPVRFVPLIGVQGWADPRRPDPGPVSKSVERLPH